MPIVIDDDTGEEVEVRPVTAFAAMASIASLAHEFPKGSAKLIEQAMAAAATQAMADGITSPEEIRERMVDARLSMKAAIRTRMNDLRSQAAAAQIAAEKQEK